LNWPIKRTNTFAVRPLSEDGEQVLRNLLDASAALWNEINYQRLMRYNDEDGFEGDVWDADTGKLEGKYKDVIGASTAQTVRRANSEAWRGFFENKKKFHDESNTTVTEHPEPPGFRGNEDDGRVLKGVIRKDAYSVEWGDRSRLEIVVGAKLRDRHNSPKSRLRLEIVGNPNWPEYEDQSRLELWYDETDSTFRASQPVTVCSDARDTPLADHKAALDIGATILSPVPPQPASNICTKVASCSSDSVRRREKSPVCSQNLKTDNTVASESGGCIKNELAAVTTPKKHCVVTCSNGCTPRVLTRCISVG